MPAIDEVEAARREVLPVAIADARHALWFPATTADRCGT